jgi:hypothetical protein
MIVVRVELWSAITGERTEIARMHISSLGTGTARVGDYEAVTFIGRDTTALDRGTVSKQTEIRGWRRSDFHVWNLVRRALQDMGYVE